MRNILTIFLLLNVLCLKAQKIYNFNYILEFEVKNNMNSTKSVKLFYLVNSKDNSYKVEARNIKPDSLNFNFLDHNGKSSNSIFKMEDFLKAETISCDCNNVNYYSNPYKYKVKDYYFENLNDTIIDGKTLHHYVIKSNKSIKYQKRKKIHQYHYFVKKDDFSFLPILYSITPYEEWKKEKNIPNGMLVYFYMKNLEGEKIHIMKLKNYLEESRYLTIPKECD